ncbi:MAG: glycosyltransferase [Gammaproteobacteria bacterium]
MPKLGLCIIANNEAPIIRRCLDSVLPLIDYLLIVDTGSTDGTQQAIQQYLQEKNLPGEVIEEPWRDFAYNRTFALQSLRRRPSIDYALMVDSDCILTYAADPTAKFW